MEPTTAPTTAPVIEEPVVSTTTEPAAEPAAEPTQAPTVEETIAAMVSKALSEKEAEKARAAEEEAKKAGMTEQEALVYELQKQLEEVENKLKQKTQEELRSTAAKTLVKNGIPEDLAQLINVDNQETVQQGIELINNSFKSAVEKEVLRRLNSTTSPHIAQQQQTKPAGQSGELTEEMVKAMLGLK